MSLGKINAPAGTAAAAAQQADPLKQAQEQAALKKACREFEGMLLAQMWKEMRKTVQKSGLMSGGFGEEIFSSMLDQAYADAASEGGALGLAELLEQQLSTQNYSRPGANLPAADVNPGQQNPYLKNLNLQGSPVAVPANQKGGLSVTS